MASMGWDKVWRRWRIFWHVTLPDGTIDKGSRSFPDKQTAQQFKDHCERRAKHLKNSIFVKQIYFDDAVEEWRLSCLQYTPATLNLYTGLVDRFIDYLQGKVVYISDLTTLQINTYLNSQLSMGMINKTVNNTMSAIKSLCLFIHENYHIPNPAAGIKKLKEDPSAPNYLTQEEYDKVYQHCDDIARPWMRFIANTGLRATEFGNLSWGDCDLQQKTITLIGKGRKKRTIGINKTALQILLEMKQRREVTPTDFVFLRENGQPLTRHCLHKFIMKACRNSGLNGRGPHAIRHFFATSLLLHGVPIIKVSVLLGHSSVTTTQRHYSHILSSDFSGVTNVLDIF
jgi:site-specific recombinase XerD